MNVDNNIKAGDTVEVTITFKAKVAKAWRGDHGTSMVFVDDSADDYAYGVYSDNSFRVHGTEADSIDVRLVKPSFPTAIGSVVRGKKTRALYVKQAGGWLDTETGNVSPIIGLHLFEIVYDAGVEND